MSEISFTQYLMPHGTKNTVRIDRPEDIAVMAQAIAAAGYSLACEMLSDYRTISLTVENDDGDLDIEICANGPEVPAAVDRLISRAASSLTAVEASTASRTVISEIQKGAGQ